MAPSKMNRVKRFLLPKLRKKTENYTRVLNVFVIRMRVFNIDAGETLKFIPAHVLR